MTNWDELDRLKLEIARKEAEREKAEAQKEVASSAIVARNSRLNDRKPGMVVRGGRGQGRRLS